jgi:hypothetical protein
MVDVAADSAEALAGGVASLLSLLIMLEQALTAMAMAAAMIGSRTEVLDEGLCMFRLSRKARQISPEHVAIHGILRGLCAGGFVRNPSAGHVAKTCEAP